MARQQKRRNAASCSGAHGAHSRQARHQAPAMGVGDVSASARIAARQRHQ